MKYARKFFGAITILMVFGLAFVLPADMTSTKTLAGQRSAVNLTGAVQQETPVGEFTASDPVTPVLTCKPRLPRPSLMPLAPRSLTSTARATPSSTRRTPWAMSAPTTTSK